MYLWLHHTPAWWDKITSTEYIKEWSRNWGSVSALSAGAYTTTLYMMVDTVKGGGRAPSTLTRLGWFFHHYGIYSRKWPLPLWVYSVITSLAGSTLPQIWQQMLAPFWYIMYIFPAIATWKDLLLDEENYLFNGIPVQREIRTYKYTHYTTIQQYRMCSAKNF